MIKSFSKKEKSKIVIINNEFYFIVNDLNQKLITINGDYFPYSSIEKEKIYNIHSFTSGKLFHTPFNKMDKGDTFLMELGFGLKLTDETYLKIGSETKIQTINPLHICMFAHININYM